MKTRRTYQVSQLSRLTGVSVRTLHHYDELGLLVPGGRTEAGYRLYTDEDVLRLQQILIQRELGFSLEEIRRWLDDPAFDRRQALRQQRQALERRAERTQEILRAIDRALAIVEGREAPCPTHEAAEGPENNNNTEDDNQKDDKETTMEQDMSSLFEGFDPAKYEAETEERWGNTEAFRISKARTRRYTESDWTALRNEQSTIASDLASVQRAGGAADGLQAMDIAERHRRFIDRWFYPCSPTMHARLADLYEADPRFAANIDKHGEGLTPFVSAAIRANSRRALGTPR